MTPDAIAQAAQTIAEARRAARALDGLPRELMPGSIEEGYAVQSAFVDLWDEAPVGWKIAGTAEEVQKLYGLSEPFFGAVFPATVLESGARPEARRFQHLCLECEFAFRFDGALPARDAPYSRDEILAAVEALMPAYELIAPRFDTLLMDAVGLAAADCALNGGLVLGSPVADWRGRDLAAQSVTLSVDGAFRAEGSGANVLGHPFNALDWLVE
ncbi:MAG: 2-keto-4-pentenoate hydratase, partial [Methyloligellaceae bacterium]